MAPRTLRAAQFSSRQIVAPVMPISDMRAMTPMMARMRRCAGDESAKHQRGENRSHQSPFGLWKG